MGFFDFLKRPDMGQELERFAQTPGALLLDVRTGEGDAGGHSPGSRNVPLGTLHQAELPADPENAPFRLRPQRRPEPSGRSDPAAGRVCPCDRPGRNLQLSWKGGQMR